MADVEFTAEQQAFVDRLVGDARIKAREKAEAELKTQSDKERAAAEQAALAEQEQWQTLAQQREARVKELEPLEARVQAYEELIDGMLGDEIKVLGKAAKTAVDGLPESMSAVEKLNWLRKNQGLFKPESDGVGTPTRTRATTDKPEASKPRLPIRF